MKTKNLFTPLTFFLLLVVSGVQYGCSTTSHNTATRQRSERVYTNLLDMLREQPKLNISGSGSNPIIRIRGNTSILSNNEPLFVVEGTPVGSGYRSVSYINVNTVESIRVLPAAQAGIYGSRGANGVVQITMK